MAGHNTNKDLGFTLVEMVVATAIMSIVILIVGGFVVSGARMSQSTRRSVAVSEKSRLTLSKMTEDLVDTGYMIIAPGASASGDYNNLDYFYLVSIDGGTADAPTYSIYYYKLDKAAKEMKYGQSLSRAALPDSDSAAEALFSDMHLLSDDVSSFDISFRTQNITEDVQKVLAKDATINLTVEKYGKSFTTRDKASFRNEVMIFDSFDHAKGKIEEIKDAE